MIFWRGMTKAQVAAAIKEELDTHTDDVEFQSDLLADLLMEHHPDVKAYGIRPDAFRRNSQNPYGARSYLLEGRYNGKWLKNSYRNAIYPPSIREKTFKMFRLAIAEQLRTHLKNYPLCSHCGALAEDVDHVEPSFSRIAENLYQIYSEAHWGHWLKLIPWESGQVKILPDQHPHVKFLRYMHAAGYVRLQSLCKSCHKAITAERRVSSKIEEAPVTADSRRETP